MSTPVTAHLDDDLYEDVVDRAEERDTSNSRVVNELLAETIRTPETATDGGTPRGGFWQAIGQSLFVAGFIVALLAPASFLSGVGMSMFGLGLMLWTNIQTHMQAGETLGEATKTTLGLN